MCAEERRRMKNCARQKRRCYSPHFRYAFAAHNGFGSAKSQLYKTIHTSNELIR